MTVAQSPGLLGTAGRKEEGASGAARAASPCAPGPVVTEKRLPSVFECAAWT